MKTSEGLAVVGVFGVKELDFFCKFCDAKTVGLLALRDVKAVFDGSADVAWCDSASPFSAFSLTGGSCSIALYVLRRVRLHFGLSRK
jgi:hypothetical protein